MFFVFLDGPAPARRRNRRIGRGALRAGEIPAAHRKTLGVYPANQIDFSIRLIGYLPRFHIILGALPAPRSPSPGKILAFFVTPERPRRGRAGNFCPVRCLRGGKQSGIFLAYGRLSQRTGQAEGGLPPCALSCGCYRFSPLLSAAEARLRCSAARLRIWATVLTLSLAAPLPVRVPR